jgi:hypothetical protein
MYFVMPTMGVPGSDLARVDVAVRVDGHGIARGALGVDRDSDGKGNSSSMKWDGMK